MLFKKTSVKWIKRSLKGLTLIIAVNALSVSAAYFSNRCITPKRNTVVFTGKNDLKDYHIPRLPDSLMVGITDLFMYTPVTVRQTFKGNRVYWCSNPSLDDFVEELKNPKYDNVILIGHGRKDSFSLKGGDAEANYLATQNIPKRIGKFYKYKGGEDGIENKTLKGILFLKCSRSKTFEGILYPHISYVSAWTDSSDIAEN